VISTDGPGTTPPSEAPVGSDAHEEDLWHLVGQPDLGAPIAEAAAARFPLRVADDGEHLVDQDGEPFLVMGDAGWSMLVQLDVAETERYLDARRAQGYNALLVNLIEHRFSDDPPRNAFGDEPFLEPGNLAQPNAAYFETARRAIERASEQDFLILLAPAYLGYQGGDEGWYQDMLANNLESLRSYGRYVGRLFADVPNIIWVNGGDFTPPSDGMWVVEAVRDGIVESGALQLHSFHGSPEDSSTDAGVDWLDLNLTYTYGAVHAAVRHDDAISDLPHLLIESQYEADQFDSTTPARLRCQAYEAVLNGSIGSVYGHGDIWQFRDAWPDALGATGGDDMTHVAALFGSLPWEELIPDVTATLITDPGPTGSAEFVSVAATPDRGVIVAYVPAARDLDVRLGPASGAVSVRWFDPTTGAYTAARASLEGAILSVDSPGGNGGDDSDWTLVVTID
jgi:hypothetical protein